VKTKEKEMQEERNWSNHLQYFFVVSEGGEKKCNYCVWIDDQALSRFAPSREFNEIVSSGREDWSKWVQAKIDQGDFKLEFK
jgi:hypothetical protein